MSEPAILSGTLTFLFTDIQNSTQLWEQAPDMMKGALAHHDTILHNAVTSNAGHVVKTTGDGVHAVFATAQDGLVAALTAQRALRSMAAALDDSNNVPILVRMGLHTGETELRNGDYYGSAVNRAARLMAIGHGGQVLLSAVTASLVEGLLPAGCELRALGEYRLRGFSRSEQVVQLVSPDLPNEFPPLRSEQAALGNLPEPLTSFVGRERELEEVKRLVEKNRLVTVIGPGGTGKTRLSLQVAQEAQADYSHGAWLLELASLSNPEQVLAAVAALWNLRPGPFGSLESQLVDYLRAKELLLIMDNCEHLVAACADLAAKLLPEAPRLTILTSSREGLGIAGEASYHLTSLNVPARTMTDVASVQSYEAVQLFIQRAQAVRDSFTLTQQNVVAVGQIVRRLDGIPLAIELAAARIAVLSPDQLAARLDDRFKLLTGGSRTALPRQQTLRALIDWSYDLLDKSEQWFFRQLGVFVGGWTLEAAEAMIPTEPTDLDALDLLSSLVNKSLVYTIDEGGSTRFSFLETIRQYARDKLDEAGELNAAREKHLAYFGGLITAFAPITSTMRQGMTISGASDLRLPAWAASMRSDFDNLRAALDWAVHTNPDLGLALTVDMTAVYAFVGTFDEETIERLRAARIAVASLPKSDLDINETRQWLQINSLLLMGSSFVSLGMNAEALEAHNQAVAEARTLGQRFEPALASAIAAGIYPGIVFGQPDLAEQAAEALEIFNRLGHRPMTFMLIAVLARDRLLSGDLVAANALLDESLALTTELKSPFWLVLAGMSVSKLALAMNRPDDARGLLERALHRLHNQGYPILALAAASDLGHLNRKLGDLNHAETLYRRTIVEWLDHGHRPGLANQLECFAFLAVHRSQLERAATLFGAAESLRDESGIPMTLDERGEYDLELANLQANLDPIAFTTAWQNGRALDMTAAVDLALS